MAGQSAERIARQARTVDVGSARPRRLLSGGATALAVAALGLAVAGSVAVTTSAQTTGNDRAAGPTTLIAQPATEMPDVTPVRTSRALRAFTTTGVDPSTDKKAAVRAAVVKEQAAQRAEDLAKAAEAATVATNAAATEARQKKLSEADQERNAAAAALEQEKVRQAVVARLAAERARAAAEEQAAQDAQSQQDPPDPTDLSATATDPNAVPIPAAGAGVSPVPGAVIGAHFGQYGIWSRYHTGLDFRAAYGTPIRAVQAGVVLYAGNSGDWAGNHVAIKHADGITTMYSHMSSMAAHAGETVEAGQVIGYVGQTGRAFGAHLHFEVYPDGVKYGDVYKAINPQPWLAANGIDTH